MTHIQHVLLSGKKHETLDVTQPTCSIVWQKAWNVGCHTTNMFYCLAESMKRWMSHIQHVLLSGRKHETLDVTHPTCSIVWQKAWNVGCHTSNMFYCLAESMKRWMSHIQHVLLSGRKHETLDVTQPTCSIVWQKAWNVGCHTTNMFYCLAESMKRWMTNIQYVLLSGRKHETLDVTQPTCSIVWQKAWNVGCHTTNMFYCLAKSMKRWMSHNQHVLLSGRKHETLDVTQPTCSIVWQKAWNVGCHTTNMFYCLAESMKRWMSHNQHVLLSGRKHKTLDDTHPTCSIVWKKAWNVGWHTSNMFYCLAESMKRWMSHIQHVILSGRKHETLDVTQPTCSIVWQKAWNVGCHTTNMFYCLAESMKRWMSHNQHVLLSGRKHETLDVTHPTCYIVWQKAWKVGWHTSNMFYCLAESMKRWMSHNQHVVFKILRQVLDRFLDTMHEGARESSPFPSP